MKRHLLSISDLTYDDAVLILDTAAELAKISDAPVKKLPTLRGRTVVNLFLKIQLERGFHSKRQRNDCPPM